MTSSIMQGLLEILARRFCRPSGESARRLRSPREAGSVDIAMAPISCLLGPFAMSFMQSACLFCSFSGSWRRAEDGVELPNLLFGIEKIHSENRVFTTLLDGAGPLLLAPCFQRTSNCSLSPMRERSAGGDDVIALDGTDLTKIACRIADAQA